MGHSVYIYGGFGDGYCLSDMYIFDLRSHEWRLVFPKGTVPPCAASMSMCLSSPSSFYVIGGVDTRGRAVNGMFDFDCKTHNWIDMLKSNTPNIRSKGLYGHTICEFEGCFFLFGGSSGRAYSNKTFKFDPRYEKWFEVVTSGETPSKRYKHCAVMVGNYMYIIGGGAYYPETEYIEIYRLHMKTFLWENMSHTSWITLRRTRWPLVPPPGYPLSRIAHSCATDGRRVYLFGGRNNRQVFSDLHVYDTKYCEWTCIIPVGEAPRKRSFHSMIYYKGSLYVFCGAYAYTSTSEVWRYQISFTPPPLSLLAKRCLSTNVNRDRRFAYL